MTATALDLEARVCRGRHCDVPIVLVPTLTGTTMALEADPHPTKGNVWVETLRGVPVAHVLTTDAVSGFRSAREPLYLSHHATCPDAAAFKRGGGRGR